MYGSVSARSRINLAAAFKAVLKLLEQILECLTGPVSVQSVVQGHASEWRVVTGNLLQLFLFVITVLINYFLATYEKVISDYVLKSVFSPRYVV